MSGIDSHQSRGSAKSSARPWARHRLVHDQFQHGQSGFASRCSKCAARLPSLASRCALTLSPQPTQRKRRASRGSAPRRVRASSILIVSPKSLQVTMCGPGMAPSRSACVGTMMDPFRRGRSRGSLLCVLPFRRLPASWKLAVLACAADRHLRADCLTMATAVLAEGPQRRIESRAGARNPRRAADVGARDRLLPRRLDPGPRHLQRKTSSTCYAPILTDAADVDIHGDRDPLQARDRSFPGCGQHPYPHRSDLLSTEHREALPCPDLPQQFLSITGAAMNHLVHS